MLRFCRAYLKFHCRESAPKRPTPRRLSSHNSPRNHITGTIQTAKAGERQWSTPPPELPIRRAASIRTCPASRKPEGRYTVHQFLVTGLYHQLVVNDSYRVDDKLTCQRLLCYRRFRASRS